jgi:hypothetical protein
MKNHIQLSGKLCTDVFLGAGASGCALAKARVKFSEADDSIWIFCVAEVAEELALFSEGEEIFLSGRLVIRGVQMKVAIAADRVESKALNTADGKSDVERWRAMRKHSENARARGR